MNVDVDVVVIGAGLAGLSAARTLPGRGAIGVAARSQRRRGRPRAHRSGRRVPARPRVPGAAHRVPRGTASAQVRRTRPAAVRPWRAGVGRIRFHTIGDPFRAPSSLVSTALAPIGSLSDKWRIAALRRRLRHTAPVDLLRGPDRSTIDALRDRSFSDTAIDRFFRPLFGGIQLDAELTTSARMFDVIFRMLADGTSAVPAAGMGAIPAQLADALSPGTIRLGTTVQSVDGTTVHTSSGGLIRARAVVVATDGPTASTLVGAAAGRIASRWHACTSPPTLRRPRGARCCSTGRAADRC